MTDSTEHAGPAGTNPAGPVAVPITRRSGLIGLVAAGWLLFRRWRRSRPFWGGILLMIAGAELLLIPLPMHSMGLILHIGIGGISGILIGAVLIVAGLLLWFNPAQRLFYSIVAVLLAIAALVASNLGGFLLGTILGIIGGSLGFAWTPLPPGAAPRRMLRRRPATPADTATGLVPLPAEDGPDPEASADTGAVETADDAGDAAPATATTATAAEPDWGRLDPRRGAAGPGTSRCAPYYRTGPNRGTVIGGDILAAMVSLLTFGLINLSPTPSPTQSTDPPAAATPTPSTSPSTSAAASPSASPAASPSPSPSASPSSAASPTVGASPSPSPSPTPTGTPPPFAISAAQSTLTASSASLTGFEYDGVVSVPTATGAVQMMQFSASSIDLSGVNLAVSLGGATSTTTASSLDFSGNVVLYTTQLSGDLLGVPTTITPGNALATILQILGQLGLTQSVTQAFSLQMTNVTTLQPFTSADGLIASSLQIS